MVDMQSFLNCFEQPRVLKLRILMKVDKTKLVGDQSSWKFCLVRSQLLSPARETYIAVIQLFLLSSDYSGEVRCHCLIPQFGRSSRTALLNVTIFYCPGSVCRSGFFCFYR